MDGRVEHSGGMQASLAGRYARALFDLAQESGKLADVEKSMGALDTALGESSALQALVASPVVRRDDAAKAMAALTTTLKLDKLTQKFLGVLAQNRRLGELGNMTRAFATLAAAHRGETSADALSDGQVKAIKAKLKERLGRDVAVNLHVDPAILGGLVVQVGSRLVDSSIRTRLNTLAVAMKG